MQAKNIFICGAKNQFLHDRLTVDFLSTLIQSITRQSKIHRQNHTQMTANILFVDFEEM